jgi:hypothetical protein
VLVHFQFRGEQGWESMGSGISSEENPLAEAVSDLRSLHGGALPAGSYRYLEVRSGSHLGTFELDGKGELLE